MVAMAEIHPLENLSVDLMEDHLAMLRKSGLIEQIPDQCPIPSST
jgi:DNA-binding IscR family transcriptional regulator